MSPYVFPAMLTSFQEDFIPSLNDCICLLGAFQ